MTNYSDGGHEKILSVLYLNAWIEELLIHFSQVFTANKDSSSKVTNWFEHPVRAQFIRVVPQTWNGVIALRLDVLGCYEGYPSKIPLKISCSNTFKTCGIQHNMWDLKYIVLGYKFSYKEYTGINIIIKCHCILYF